MKCQWCEYNIYSDSDELDIYYIFDSNNKPTNFIFCSLNCGVAYIYKQNIDVDKRINLLYDNYKINSFIFEAKDKRILLNFGGKLSYEDYRVNFVCPNIKKVSKNKFLSYENKTILDEYKISKYSNNSNNKYSEEDVNNFDY